MTRSASPGVERGIGGAGVLPASTATLRLEGIPIPPSTNSLYANNKGKGRGRFKTQRYLTWQRAAGNAIEAQETTPIHGDVDVSIVVPRDDRRDVDNYAKAALDLLVLHGLIDDDRHIISLHISKLTHANDRKHCTVTVRPA